MYSRKFQKINPLRMAVIANCIELYVGGNRSSYEIAEITGLTHTTICRYLTVYYFQYIGSNKVTLIRQSSINPPVIVNKPKIVKKVKKPVYWTKGAPKSVPDYVNQDYQLKRKLSATLNYNSF